MLILRENFIKLHNDSIIALGSFDGLHLGHLELIKNTIKLASENNAKSMIYTFNKHPLYTIDKDNCPKMIINNQTKINLLKKLGIDIVNLIDFDDSFMKISPEEFISKIIGAYNVKGIVVGFNYRFGYKNQGDTDFLEKLSKKLGFQLLVIEPVMYKNEIVSSSRIRQLISCGEIREANEMLMQPFMLEGEIIKGNEIGRKISFPTANLKYDIDDVLPGIGVYLTEININNTKFAGITNVGLNPTVGNSNLTVETHIINFHDNLYGERISVYFIERMRNEIKFSSLEELKKQLTHDKEYAVDRLTEILP